ncbi:RHOMBOID-like protein 9, chloroplastic [Spinacia oleracea]|uniref:RHOMBOID-like protein 9, chloroplastic n=1 Tax=Spinacia oleracea TaxID=3562 RepID=A0A9R0IEE8_SPIOL|nr:RHOMBOID-like protein 9, chloroplastic [Spinacia oleracea]
MATPLPISMSFSSEFHVLQEGFKCSSSTPSTNIISRKNISLFSSKDHTLRTKMNRRLSFSKEKDHGKWCNQCLQTSRTEISCPTFYASESDFTEKHKSSLEIYLEKLQNQAKQVSQDYVSDASDVDDQTNQLLARTELGLLEKYLDSLKEDTKSEECLPYFSDRNASGNSEDSVSIKGMAIQEFERRTVYDKKAASTPMYDEKESGNLYLISTLLSINIAVFLFEIASPVKSSDYNLYTLPLMYGAKVNDLIMVGQWWRLVTPMFLHSGPLHIALGSWVLVSFGPQVCKGYGSFTFLLIFILGGISGNFSSFLHTSEATVGGSGPVFAVIGAWLVYQIQNKELVSKELSDSMFQKAVIATALSFFLGNFGPVDNWTSLGAAVSGIIYGFLTSPVAQVDDAPASSLQERNSGMKEEIKLNSTQTANPCKSLLIFTIFVSALSSLILFNEFSLDNLEFEELVQIIE